MTGSKYLQSPVSTGSSFHLVCDAFTPSRPGLWYRMLTYTSATTSLCAAVTEFSDGANRYSSGKPRGTRLGSTRTQKLAVHCTSWVIWKEKQCWLHWHQKNRLQSFPSQWSYCPLRQTAYTKQRSSAKPLLQDCVCTLQLMLLGSSLGLYCLFPFLMQFSASSGLWHLFFCHPPPVGCRTRLTGGGGHWMTVPPGLGLWFGCCSNLPVHLTIKLLTLLLAPYFLCLRSWRGWLGEGIWWLMKPQALLFKDKRLGVIKVLSRWCKFWLAYGAYFLLASSHPPITSTAF